jgi:DNA gyrase subunit B
MINEMDKSVVATPPEATAAPLSTAGAADYEPEDVDLLRDAAHIRQNPGVYIGELGVKGLHHLVYELVANSVDEALAGFSKHISVRIWADGSLSVSDDGRGIPVEEHPTEKISTLELVMTKLGAGAKFSKGSYKVSIGLHGMGAKAVTALSEWCEAQVQRNGRVYLQEYERGYAVTPVRDSGPSKRTGTRIKFKPDPDIFADVTFDHDTLETRLRELAFLNKGLTISLHDERINKEDVFKYDGGLAEFIKWVNRTEDVLHQPIAFERTMEGIQVDVAMQWTKGEEERHRCYTNNGFNQLGGLHLSGFRSALTRTLNTYGAREDWFKNVSPIGEDFREGLTLILSVQVPEPKFDSQEKRRLVHPPEVEGIVTSVVNECLSKHLEEHPKEAQVIMKKVQLAAEAREAATKAKKALKERKSILSGGGLPGKLYDCTSRERDQSELFLVEGDSAGGSAESGRNREFQAVLPLRGKPLNVEKARLENLVKNEEICNLISAIGIDIGNNEDIARLRYGKVIILTDADVDGQHIRTLLLTFFYRQMAKLVAEGKIFVARPPLYKVVQKKEARFVQTAEELTRELMERGLRGTQLAILPPPEANGGATARTLEGEELAALLRVTSRLDESLTILERSGLNLTTFLARATDKGLPLYRFVVSGREEFCYTAEEAAAFRAEQERQGRLLATDDLSGAGSNGHTNGHSNGATETYREQELHEVRKVNRGLEELRKWELRAGDLLPAPRIAGREPPPRLVLESGEQKRPLVHLRDLVAEVRKLGEKGMTITRFKGLGEMDPLELWETTLDPDKRTLMQVQLDDALKADELFRTLMGEKVEPRREFIIEHAMKVKDIDYHGA